MGVLQGSVGVLVPVRLVDQPARVFRRVVEPVPVPHVSAQLGFAHVLVVARIMHGPAGNSSAPSLDAVLAQPGCVGPAGVGGVELLGVVDQRAAGLVVIMGRAFDRVAERPVGSVVHVALVPGVGL